MTEPGPTVHLNAYRCTLGLNCLNLPVATKEPVVTNPIHIPPAERYIVIRPAPGLPPGYLPAHLDGQWLDTHKLGPAGPHDDEGGTAIATNRYETRADGMIARVYEVRSPTLTAYGNVKYGTTIIETDEHRKDQRRLLDTIDRLTATAEFGRCETCNGKHTDCGDA